jgi:hypothetical protein
VSAAIQQIKVAYEVNRMSPEEISCDLGFDLTVVKAALMNGSSKYRKDCGMEPKEEDRLNFTDDEAADFKKVIHETALMAEHSDGSIDYKTRLAAAIYGRDDKKGRKELVRQVGGSTFNLFQFNQQLQLARGKASEMRRIVEG